ncbi:MAG TPA: AAC(3) family N-acetyltransferase [bacterium]|nr:AAC(3) family N-acetyltransferase [bacterium]HOL48267.1 AAC(3) family N-acetyltransferase [bacterium]HPQ20158.1 AAC(3) family N-acetyltransferase [bacterium]
MKLVEIFNKLELPDKEAVIFFHIASEKLKTITDIKGIFKAIDDYFDKHSTICMPSYPFTGTAYKEYLSKNPIFDVRNTPCRVNLICEIFRRKENVIRSIHPWCSVAAMGERAYEIVSEHHLDKKVFGKKSPFQKILKLGGYVVGLGVDCNTNSFAHLPDEKMFKNYSFEIYEKKYYNFKAIDYSGKETKVKTNILLENVIKNIKPRKMKPFFYNQNFYKEYRIDNIEFYRLKLDSFLNYTIKINKNIIKTEGKPIYYV